MPIIGGNVNDLDVLIRRFRHSAATVEEMIGAVTSELGATEWIGPVADRFRSGWEMEFVPMLRRLEENLREGAANLSLARDRLARALH
jgi:hypothetical protein